MRLCVLSTHYDPLEKMLGTSVDDSLEEKMSRDQDKDHRFDPKTLHVGVGRLSLGYPLC